MTLLLDTHALLWWLADDPQLPHLAREAIRGHREPVYVSAVSAWEITVKRTQGKLEVPEEWVSAVEEDGFVRLEITWDHVLEVGELPDVHRDPFDRLLVAQARVEGMTLVTGDAMIASYGTPVLWSGKKGGSAPDVRGS